MSLKSKYILCAFCGNLCIRAKNGSDVGYCCKDCRKQAIAKQQKTRYDLNSKITVVGSCKRCGKKFTIKKNSKADYCIACTKKSPLKESIPDDLYESWCGKPSSLDLKVKQYRVEGKSYAEVQKAETLAMVGSVDVNI